VVDKALLKSLPAMIAMARASNAQVQGNLSATLKYAELALQHIPADDLFRRAQATIMLEFTHWAEGDLEAARRAMGDWMDSMQKTGNFIFAVASAFAMADILVEQGHLREAEKTYRQSLQLAAEHGKEAQQVTAHHYLGLAMLHHEIGEEATAAQHLLKARELDEQTTLVDWPYRWRVAQARLKQDEGDIDEALVLLDEARGVYVRNPIPDLRPIDSLKARAYLKQGRLAKTQDWVRERGLSADDEISYLREFEHLTLTRVLIAEYKLVKEVSSILKALNLLERLLNAAEAQRRTGSVLAILITQALAYQAQGKVLLARASIERALVLAQPEGYFRIFVNEGESMRLLIWDFRSNIEMQSRGQGHPLTGYLDKLLVAFAQPATSAKSITPGPKPEIIEPLSQSELKILQLMAQGLSNQEIRERLFLALSTVKGHNRNMFDKLQVQSRTEAVARARELGLL
jgi:LuxR family maltose regulon positive regulatory protein